MVRLGTNLPEHLIGKDLGAFGEFLQGVEQLGYDYVTMGDHVLGADVSVRPDWAPYQGKPPLYGIETPWHEPLVMFGYMAALTKKLELCTGILVSPQRQSALLAKQAAQVDILTGGRIRFVISAGWNDVEYEGMGVDYASRGKIMKEQMEVMRLLWTQEVVTYHGEFHTLNAVGINPLPSKPIPLWLGGTSKPVMRRIGQMGDGWFPYYPYFDPAKLEEDWAFIQQVAKDAGRDPKSIGVEGAIYFEDTRFELPENRDRMPTTLEGCVERAQWWKKFGASTFTVSAPWANLAPDQNAEGRAKRASSTVEKHLRALEEFKQAVGKDF